MGYGDEKGLFSLDSDAVIVELSLAAGPVVFLNAKNLLAGCRFMLL